MKSKIKIITMLLSILFLTTSQTVFATTPETLEIRIKKLEEHANSNLENNSMGQISNAIKLSGAIEIDYSYADDSNTSSQTINDSTSNLDVGTVEIGIEATLHKYLTAVAVLKGESLDADNNVFLDEAFFEIKKQGAPIYLIAGKRVQPFGIFENLFINDPLTCELYEINDTGLTVGFVDEALLGLSLSATVYRGETLITKVNDAGLGWSRDNTAGYTTTNDVDSFIISGTLSPLKGINLSVFFNSEPGDTNRNTSAGTAVHAELAGFILDAEYIGALQRETHITDNTEYKETAWTVSLGYQVVDPLLVAIRYESFDADKKASENLENRYSLGATYTLFENDSFVCNLMGEYRKTEYETTVNSTNNDEINEFFSRISIEF